LAATHRLADEEWQRTKQALDNNKWNVAQAARDLGIARQTVQSRILSARARQIAPEGLPLDGFHVRGVSTLYDAQGDVKATWVKSQVDSERQEQIVRETIADFVSAIKPAKATYTPKRTNSDLCVAYCIGDAHLGLYSWGAETGADFDLQIAQRDLMAAADRLVSATPTSDEAIIVQLGDFYHADDSKNETPNSGNKLDVDSRFPKVIRAGISTMRYMIDRALEKHKLVRVRNVAGNHDPHSSITLTEALIGYYSKEPRVIVEDSPKAFFVFRFGSNLIGITHGHTGKPDRMPGILAVDGQKHWSECEFRYVWHGHIHNKKVFEEMGVIVESFRTLAAKDAWHAEAGYRAGREMQAIVLHKDFGEVERHTAGIKHLRVGV
jgi:hypothetical protein